MKDNSNSRFGNKRFKTGKSKMVTQALIDARDWTDKLMAAEHKGRGDKEYLVRFRLSEKTGVSERYLYRLQYQWKSMRDIAGEPYRLLDMARRKYLDWCEENEAAAGRMRQERLELRQENEAGPKPVEQAQGMDSADN